MSRRLGFADLSLRQRFLTFLSMCKKQLIEMSRYPLAFFSSFAMIFIILMMFVLGAILFLPSEGAETGPLTGTMTYGFILFMFLSDTLFFIGRTIRNEQFQGTLESFYLTPANKFSNLVSRIFVSIVWTGLNSIAAVIIISFLVGQVPMENVLLGCYLLVLSLSGFFGIGFVFAAVTINLKESTDLMANFTQFFLMIFCAMFFPFKALPDILRNYVSKLIPISYSVDAFRSVLSGVTPELLPFNAEVAIVTIFGVATPPIGYALFKMAERRARRRGGLAEY